MGNLFFLILKNKSNTLLALLGKDENSKNNDEIWDNVKAYKSQFNLSILDPNLSEDVEEYQIDEFFNNFELIDDTEELQCDLLTFESKDTANFFYRYGNVY